MGDIETVIIYTSLAGACILLGGVLAKLEHIRPAWMENEFRHFIIALGGGVLLAVVTFILFLRAWHMYPGLLIQLSIFWQVAYSFFCLNLYLVSTDVSRLK